MPLPAVGVLFSLAGMIAAIGKWILEFILVYGKKVAFFFIAIGIYFSLASGIIAAIRLALDSAGASAYFQNASQFTALAQAIFPTNAVTLVGLVLSVEFSILFFVWAQKVLDVKVDFFG